MVRSSSLSTPSLTAWPVSDFLCSVGFHFSFRSVAASSLNRCISLLVRCLSLLELRLSLHRSVFLSAWLVSFITFGPLTLRLVSMSLFFSIGVSLCSFVFNYLLILFLYLLDGISLLIGDFFLSAVLYLSFIEVRSSLNSFGVLSVLIDVVFSARSMFLSRSFSLR